MAAPGTLNAMTARSASSRTLLQAGLMLTACVAPGTTTHPTLGVHHSQGEALVRLSASGGGVTFLDEEVTDFGSSCLEIGVEVRNEESGQPVTVSSLQLGLATLEGAGGPVDVHEITANSRLFFPLDTPWVMPFGSLGIQIADADFASIDPILSVLGPQLGLHVGGGVAIALRDDPRSPMLLAEYFTTIPLIESQDEDGIVQISGEVRAFMVGVLFRF